MRDFGNGNGALRLRMTWFAPGDMFDVALIGNWIQVGYDQSGKISYRFLPSGEEVGPFAPLFGRMQLDGKNVPMAEIGSSDLPGRVYNPNEIRPPITESEAAGLTSLTVDKRGQLIDLETGSMGLPLTEIRKCTADLVKSWGLNPTIQAKLRSHPLPANYPGNWIATTDYPTGLVDRGVGSMVYFRLMVDDAGTISSCHVQNSISVQKLGDYTCKLMMKRARMKPAIGPDGKPVASYWVSSVRWTH